MLYISRELAVHLLLDDKKAEWSNHDAEALVDYLIERGHENLCPETLRYEWDRYPTPIEALKDLAPQIEPEGDEDYASEALHELTGIVYRVIEHGFGVLVQRCND